MRMVSIAKLQRSRITKMELYRSAGFKKKVSGNALVPVHDPLSQHRPRSGSRAETPKYTAVEKALGKGDNLPDKRVSNRA